MSQTDQKVLSLLPGLSVIDISHVAKCCTATQPSQDTQTACCDAGRPVMLPEGACKRDHLELDAIVMTDVKS